MTHSPARASLAPFFNTIRFRVGTAALSRSLAAKSVRRGWFEDMALSPPLLAEHPSTPSPKWLSVRYRAPVLAHHAKEGRRVAAPPCAANRSEPIQLRQINVTEMLLVVSVRTSDVNETVIGGLQSGENVAVAVSV
jgi:hypothetical protein